MVSSKNQDDKIISVRFSPEEMERLQSYSLLYDEKISTFIKQTILEFIDDFEDLNDADYEYNKWSSSGKKSLTPQELAKMTGIDLDD
jgi:predicted DNA-binding protein